MSEREIGFDRDIKLEWLDSVANQVAMGQPVEGVRKHIHELLGKTLARAALTKTTTVLLRVWSQVPQPALQLRDRIAFSFLDLTAEERLTAHWALAMASYPFFADVATSVGRLLALQGDVQNATLKRRLAERWGDRSLMPQAARKVIRSMVNWGVLRDPKPGVYIASPTPVFPTRRCMQYLVEALLVNGKERSVPVAEIDTHPALFPFRIEVLAQHLRSAKQFNVHREGIDSEIVELSSS